MALETVTPVRDEQGHWAHPALEEVFNRDSSREYIPRREWNLWLKSQGIEVYTLDMDYDLDESDPAWVAHFEEGEPGCPGWKPDPPSPEWRLLAIYDTEDGPIAMFYRETDLEDPGHE